MLSQARNAMFSPFTGEAGAIALEELQRRHELPDSRYLKLQGMRVHYRDVNHTGNPAAPVVIMLHGIFASLHTWNDWTDSFSPHFRVISIDTPNFGLTGPHPEGMRKHLYSDFLNEFTDALGIPQAHMVGNSLGGWMSWEFAARFPHKVNKVILLDSAGFFFMPPLVLLSMGLPFGGWLASRTPLPRKALYAIVRTTYGRKERLQQSVMDRYYDLLMRPGNRMAAAAVLRFIRNRAGFDTHPLQQVKQPVLVMWGKNDGWIPVAHVEKFRRALPQAESVIYDDCGHMPMEEIPHRSAVDALRFLQQPHQHGN